MSTATRVALADARRIAVEIAEPLRLGCDRVMIAGSIRRERPDVGDIELVAVPRFRTEVTADGFFGERRVDVDELAVLVDGLILDGTLAPHPTDPKRGGRYSKLLHVRSGLQLDLFTARPETFGIIYLIRTGPATYSQNFVTSIRRRGFHVGDGALHRGGLGCGRVACETVPTREELDVYEAVGLPWVPPDSRL